MKKLLLLLTLTTLISCCKKDDKTVNQIDLLPPATQTGENTVGCLVNGKAFLPNHRNLVPTNCNYIDGKDFSLMVSKKSNQELYGILITIDNTPLQVGQTYTLNTLFGSDAKSGEYDINGRAAPNPNYYSTTPNVTGELTITHHDFQHAFLSGTFWFNAINSVGDTVKIREGRFDMEY